MKKTLLTLSIVICSLGSGIKAQVDGWFNYGYELETSIGANVNYYQSHIFPDSTVQVEYSSGLGNVWMHSLGQVFDPRSVYYDYGSVSIIEDQPYMIESIGFPFRYIRPQDANSDTLVIQLFKQENIDTLFVDPWPGGQYANRSYARLWYDSLTHRGANPYMEISHLLTNSDTSLDVDWFQVAIGEQIAANEVFAINVTFYPGNPYNAGDTLDVEYIPTPANLRNDFIMNYYVDEDISLDVGHYNHAIIGDDAARYNINDNGWGGQFWPGMASGGGLYHAAISAKISTSVSIEESAPISNMHVYPNPSQGLSTLTIDLRESSSVSVEIRSIDGKLIASDIYSNQPTGQHAYPVNIDKEATGVYFISVKTNETVLSQKILKY